ncbi:hypothetical protein QBC41DRAFT_269574 [Cercophora samala]|uniref:Uncharacterized protein n=1 Tax=Cercophora samala TaxID=330535 RepID=A0AA40DEE8_9PEZI|nr:hypothetical protein QBC41DRAFT_269574 [Cercophora samala]
MGQQQYQNVLGLFLAWEEDGGEHASTGQNPFHMQLEELAHTLQLGYNYDIEPWLIPSDKYPRALDRKVNEIVERSNTLSQKDKSTLLIIYYGGHAVANPHEPDNDLLLVPYPKSKDVSVSWATDVLSRLQYVEGADILILLDCCYAQRAQHAIDHMHRPPPRPVVTLAAVDIDGKAIQDGDYTFTQNLCAQLEEFANFMPRFSISQFHQALRRRTGSWRRRQPDGKIPDPLMSSNTTHEFGFLGPIDPSEEPAGASTGDRPVSPQSVGPVKEEQRLGTKITERSSSTPAASHPELPPPRVSSAKSHPTTHGVGISPLNSTTSLKKDSWEDNVSYCVGPDDVDTARLPSTPSSISSSRSISPVDSKFSRSKSPDTRPWIPSVDELPYIPTVSSHDKLNIYISPPDAEAVMPAAPMSCSPAASASSLQDSIPPPRNRKHHANSYAARLSPSVPYGGSSSTSRGGKSRDDTAPYPRNSQSFMPMSPNRRSQTFDNAEFDRRARDGFGGSRWKAEVDSDYEEEFWTPESSEPLRSSYGNYWR